LHTVRHRFNIYAK